MNNKNTSKNLLLFFYKLLFLFIILLISIGGIILKNKNIVKADNTYYSNLSDEDLDNLFKLSVSDLGNAWDWISNFQTYTIIEDSDNGYIYWWNAPNIQQSAINSTYDIILNSGYGQVSGTNPAEENFLIDIPGDSSDSKTALERYGFKIPNAAYLGERPLITISISGVIKPDGFWNGVGRLIKLVFKGDIIDCPTQENYNSLSYVAPNDYFNGTNTFETWVSNNWDNFIEYVPDGAILNPNASKNTNGEYNGLVWVKDSIINNNGLQNSSNSDHEYICSELQQICGADYGDVAICIMLQTIKASESDDNDFLVIENPKVERIMPYDLSRLNSEDKNIFDNVIDYRAEMQNSFYSSGYDKEITNYIKQAYINLCGKIAEITVSINNCGNFNFIEGIGLDPTILWTNEIIEFLVNLMMIVYVLYLLKVSIQILKGSRTPLSLVSKSILIFIVCICIYTFSKTPEDTYNFIKNTSSRIFNSSNITLTNNDNLNKLYGNGDSHDKENCSLWLPYFNTWTIYNTNHSINDKEQLIKIDENNKKPEEYGLTIPYISDVEQNLWSTILADNATKTTKYSNNIYRMVDHFMAPRIKVNDISKNNLDIDVAQNENYNGNIQSTINFSSLLWQILILLTICIKVILFYEFVLNIMLLFFNLSLVVFDMNEIKKVLKTLSASMINVFFTNIYSTILIWASLFSSGISGIIIAIMFYAISLFVLKTMINLSNSSPFKPKILKVLTKAFNKVSRIFY